jgi:hypothetical protein
MNEEDTTNTSHTTNQELLLGQSRAAHRQLHKRSSDESFPLDLTTRTLSQHVKSEAGCKKVKTERTEAESDGECYSASGAEHKSAKSFSFRSGGGAGNKPALNGQSPLKHIQSIADAYLISQLDQASAAYKSSILQQSQSPTSNSAGEMSSLN